MTDLVNFFSKVILIWERLIQLSLSNEKKLFFLSFKYVILSLALLVNLFMNFANLMKTEFERRMMRKFTHFLSLQIKQTSEGIFINESKYGNNVLKIFYMDPAKPCVTPMDSYQD